MTCDKVRSRLGAYADHELPVRQAEVFEHHLRSCESCRQEFERLTRLASILSADTVLDVPSVLAERIVLHGRQQLSARRHLHVPHILWWEALPAPMRAAAVITLMVGLSAGTLLGLSTSKRAHSPLAGGTVPQPDAVSAMHLDYLTESPGGSPARAYLALAALTDEGR